MPHLKIKKKGDVNYLTAKRVFNKRKGTYLTYSEHFLIYPVAVNLIIRKFTHLNPTVFFDTLLSINPVDFDKNGNQAELHLMTSSLIHSLQRVNELLGLDRWRVDDLINVLSVAVCIGGGDVNEGLEVVHLPGQAEELLRGDHVQLQGVSACEERERNTVKFRHMCGGGKG